MLNGQFTTRSPMALSQPDGYSEEFRVHAAPVDPYQAAIDEVASALVKATAIRLHLDPPSLERILDTSRMRFRLLAGQAVALCHPSTVAAVTHEVIGTIAADYDGDVLGPYAEAARIAVQLFQAELMERGEKAVQR